MTLSFVNTPTVISFTAGLVDRNTMRPMGSTCIVTMPTGGRRQNYPSMSISPTFFMHLISTCTLDGMSTTQGYM